MPIGHSHVPRGAIDRLYRRIYRVASQHSRAPDEQVTQDALDGFRRAQRLAFAATRHVATLLRPGITEREAARLLAEYLRAHGTERYLHRPFAWFGDHAGFYGYTRYDDFHPGDRELRTNDVAILDVSPVVDGYVGDVGHSLTLGRNPQLDSGQEFLRELRDELPSLFASSRTPAEIWAHVNRRIEHAGFDTVHAKYPHCVLGHRVFRIRPSAGRPVRLGWGGFGWFSLEANLALHRMGPSAALGPEHVGRKFGLWAIEPHIGWKTGGCKFEEILVVDSNGARWLDDDVPHLRDARGERPPAR